MLSIPLNELPWPEVDSESISTIESKLVDWKRTLESTGFFALGQDWLCSRVFCFETIFLAWVGVSNLIELSFLQQIRAKIPFRNLGKLKKRKYNFNNIQNSNEDYLISNCIIHKYCLLEEAISFFNQNFSRNLQKIPPPSASDRILDVISVQRIPVRERT